MHLKFDFNSDSEIIGEEIRVTFGLQDFLTNVGGFLGLYLGCSIISVIELFYFALNFLLRKLLTTKNQVGVANEEHETQESNKNPDIDEEVLKSQNLGLTLVEIFDLEEFFK